MELATAAPGRTGSVRSAKRASPRDEKVRVVVFSMHAEPIYAARALRLGARGYVSKSAGAEELVTAVKRISERDGSGWLGMRVGGVAAVCPAWVSLPARDLSDGQTPGEPSPPALFPRHIATAA